MRSSGPAVREPDSPSWTNTATARSPLPAIIQAWVLYGALGPYSAVPVLAITAPSTSLSTRPLPPVTTARIICCSWSASSAVSGLPLALGLSTPSTR